MVNTKKQKDITPIVDDLKEIARKDFQEEHFLSSSIIIFQTVVGLLRNILTKVAQHRKVNKDTMKVIENELSFSRLVLFFDLICPNNGMSQDLRRINTKRNKIFHSLFYEFESLNSLNKTLKNFCDDAAKMNFKLGEYMDSKVPELLKD